MHAIFFGMKRAFHASLRVGRSVLRTPGLTPARFDMLTVIARGMLQRDVQRMLGVSAPTVSRMLRSLEERGWVVRRICRDTRQRWIELTSLGGRVLRQARRGLIGWGYITLAIDSALVGERFHDFSRCLLAKDAFELALWRIRRAFGDSAELAYTWHPDD